MKGKFILLLLSLMTFTTSFAQDDVVLSCPDDNHPHAIDLGVGLKFSCCNMGASKPEDYGSYYAWGEVEEKATYSLDNYQYVSHNQSGLQTFTQIGDLSVTPYDVAYVKWGDSWRIPMEVDIKLLYMKCRYADATINGVNGIKFTGPNGNSIFLPFAGNKESSTDNQGQNGNYWLSDQYGDSKAKFLLIKNNRYVWVKNDDRYIGKSIRPVYIDRNGIQSCPDDNHPHAIDLGLPSGTKWACCNVGASDPIQYGEYFSWGETAQKDEYNNKTYSYCHAEDGDYSLARWDFLGEDIGGTQYDAAYVKWGENWRMPSLADITELINHCEYKPVDTNIHGLVFTGPNQQSIFLPSGYWAYFTRLSDVAYTRHQLLSGFYWTSSQNMDVIYDSGFDYTFYEYLAFALEFNAVPTEYSVTDPIMDVEVCEYRHGGMNIRPIQNITSSIDMTQQSDISLHKGIYTVQGTKISDDQKSTKNLPKGIYIVNGKKLVVK